MKPIELTPEQRAAIEAWKERHGRTWKEKLSEHWMYNNPRALDMSEESLLRQVRNTFGPSWLRKVKL